MNHIHNFITSTKDVQASAQFKEVTREKMLVAYDRAASKNILRKWLMALSVTTLTIAASLILFLKISSHISAQVVAKQEISQMDQDAQSFENDVQQDSVLTEATQIQNVSPSQ